ncbi:MAG: hypothetical protein NXI30_13380 [bacterium]|nr:hypothetical protein [bacterium]
MSSPTATLADFSTGQVAGVCSAPIVAEARARGFDVRALAEGTGAAIERFEDRRGRVPWTSFVPFAARATRMLGEDVIRDLASEAVVDSVPSAIRRILPRLADSRPLFHLAPRWWGPWVFQGTHGVCETLPDGRLREIVKIHPEHEACPEFFSGLTGTLRAIPRLTGQTDALVEVHHDGREGEFLITPPPRRRFRDRWRTRPVERASGVGATLRARSALDEIEEIGFAREALLTERRSLHLVSAELDREQRDKSTLQNLADLLLGDSDSTKSLLEGLVSLLLERHEIAGASLTLRSAEGEEEGSARGGRRSGSPERTVALRVGEREIGQIALWAVLEGDDLESIAPLEAWIAFALEFGRARALNAQLRRLLEENTADWQDMESRLERLVAHLDLPASDDSAD